MTVTRPARLFRRQLLAAACLLLAPAGRARAAGPDDAADIARVAAYLNTIHTLKARFLQVAPNGTTSGGTAWLERPGRMRFQYDPPSPLLLVAGRGVVVFHDAELDQTSNIPLANTPLGILLADRVELTGAVTVQAIDREPGQLSLTLARTATPGDGTLTLVLADRPLLLRSWTVTDAQGNQTKVSLLDVVLGGTFDPALFDYAASANKP